VGEQGDGRRTESQAKAHEADVRRVQDVARAQMEAVEERERRMKEDFALFEAKMQQSFKALAGDALKSSTGEFLKLADQKFAGLQQASAGELDKKRQAFEQLVKPLSETLQKTDAKLAEIDKNRAATHAALVEQVRQMSDASVRLSEETRKLGDALRKPEVRGAYGEMQRARGGDGMTALTTFRAGERIDGEAAARVGEAAQRARVVVDAKTNIQAYPDAVQATTPRTPPAPDLRATCIEQRSLRAGVLEERGRQPEFVDIHPRRPVH
jgi:DNA recombination protein RmuC